MQDQKPTDIQSNSPDREMPQWQPPVLIPLDLADAEAGPFSTGVPDGLGCS